MKLNECQRSRLFFDLVQRSLKFQIYFFFSETLDSFETKFYRNSYSRMGFTIFTDELGHMTKMAAMPIYMVKTFKKSSSLTPIDR